MDKTVSKNLFVAMFYSWFPFLQRRNLLINMKEGDLLELIREPENEYDDYAIAFYFNKEKVGYVPSESNEILSRLLDSKVIELLAEITHLETKAKAWENVHMRIADK